MTNRYRPHPRLTEGDLVDRSPRCPSCGFRGPRRQVCVAYQRPRVMWLLCPDCRAYSASHMPSEDYLDRYYSSYYDDEKGVTFHSDRRLAEHVGRLIVGDERGSRLRILDFGGGDGSVARILAAKLAAERPALEVEITVVDPSGEPAGPPNGGGFRSLRTLAEIAGDRFDLVIASAVLEHVPMLAATVSAVLGAVGAGGVFYARTPCSMPFRRLIPAFPMKFPMHVHDLGPSYWSRVIDRYEFHAQLVVSQPSIVASGWTWRHLPRSAVSHLCKWPARVEGVIRRQPRDYFWPFSGGWEVVFRRFADGGAG